MPSKSTQAVLAESSQPWPCKCVLVEGNYMLVTYNEVGSRSISEKNVLVLCNSDCGKGCLLGAGLMGT